MSAPPQEGPSTSAVVGTEGARNTLRPGVGSLGLGVGLGAHREGRGKDAEKVLWPNMGTLEWLVVKQNPDNPLPDSKFVAIAALHSEILLVSAGSQKLFSWACDESIFSPVPHPLTQDLGLLGERIAIVTSSDMRATVVTESMKVATFYDALIRGLSLGTWQFGVL